MNCTASAAGRRQKIEYGFLLRMAGAARRDPAAADPVGAQGVPRPDDVHAPARRRRVRARHGAARSTSRPARGRCAAWCRAGRISARCCPGSRHRCWSSPVSRTRRSRSETIAMAEAIPGAAVAVLDGVAHLAALENPAVVNKLIEEFCVPRVASKHDRQAPAQACRRCTCGATRSTRLRSLREIRETDGVAHRRQRLRHAGLPRHPPRRRQGGAVRPRALLQRAAHPVSSCPARRTSPRRSRPARGRATCSGLDPPEHQRLRRMLTAEFTIRRMKRLEPRIVEIVDAAPRRDGSRRAASRSGASFALPIPSLVICELLGVPYDDRDDFQQRSARQLDLSIPIPERLELQRAGPRRTCSSLVERARRQPGEDILGMLVREHGDELTDDELIGIAGLLLLAGHETTSNMLGPRHAGAAAAPRPARRGARRPGRGRARRRGTAALAVDRAHRDSADHHHRGRDRRRDDPGGSAGLRVAAVGQPRPGVHRLAGRARHPPRRARASGVRPRRAPLPRRSAGPHGDADRVPRAAAPVPRRWRWPRTSTMCSSGRFTSSTV